MFSPLSTICKSYFEHANALTWLVTEWNSIWIHSTMWWSVKENIH